MADSPRSSPIVLTSVRPLMPRERVATVLCVTAHAWGLAAPPPRRSTVAASRPALLAA